MSGDVQPRKRKDKKRKKDEVVLEEHRGTAATFAEGEMLMHSQQEHGTGGHWCAKIIFFSLLAVLITLIGLIILENRGLTELEANSVESQYSGLLDGWIEDTPDDDHHDEHTLDLKHHQENEDVDEHEIHEFDDDDDEHDEEFDHDEVEEDEEEGDDDGGDEDGDDEDEEENVSQEVNDEDEDASKEVDDDDDDVDDDDDNGNEEDAADEGYDNDFDSNEDEDGEIEKLNIETTENRYSKPDDGEDDDDDDDEDEDNDNDEHNDNDNDDEDDDDDNENGVVEANDDGDNDSNERADHDDDGSDAQSVENDDDDEENSMEEQDDEDDDEHEEDHEGEAEEEIEKIEKEVSDQEEPESTETALPDVSAEKEEETSVEVVSPDEEYEVDDKEFLEVDDLDEPVVERIEAPPPGKPFVEIEDEVSTEIPTPDTLAEEEEYEKQQEELRQQEAQSTQMWLKLAVGGALLAATHAVLRRVTAPRDTPENEQDEHASREETPLTDRRMTLVPDESSKVIPPQSLQPKVEEEIVQKVASVVKSTAVQKQESDEVEDDEVFEEEDQEVQVNKNDNKNKELYSDEDEIEVDEEVDDEEEVEEKKEVPKPILKATSAKKEPEPEPEDVPDDVEIIEDEQIEEEVEEEVEDEEEISDVDDAELLSRLEAKYGRLPEPERPGQRHKDGGNSLEDDWPGEPSDPYWKEQLEKAEQELRQGAYGACEERASAARLADSGRARWLRARALDQLAEVRRDNKVLARAIAAYMKLLEMNERLSDKKLLEVALRTIDRIQFRGTYINAEPVYKLLIRRFPNDVTYRNNLTISFLMANRADLASEVLKETLRLWPDDRVALAHYGFILKTEQNKLEEAVTYFQRALAGDAGAANEPRFYYHLGDALLMLGRKDEAHEVHKRGTTLGHFLSPSQRSLYNVPRLKSKPWWDVWSTPYAGLARELEASWREILREGEAAQSLYEKEKEGLRERGEWSQLDLFVRGREVAGRCARAPVTCRIVKKEPAAQCRRGQVKFSLMSGGSHVRAHVGPTNCRLRLHLALANTERTYLRVDQETRQWQTGKVLMFDDSFEHEVWHNGSRARLVLIVDVWHPDLTPRERLTLPPI